MKKTFARTASSLLALLLIVTLLPLGALASSRQQADQPPVPPKSAASAAKEQVEKKVEEQVNPFSPTMEGTAALYKAQSEVFTVSPILNTEKNHKAFFDVLAKLESNDSLKKFEWDHDEANKTNEGSFLVVLRNGTRLIYSLNQNNVIQAGKYYYQIPAEDYQTLLNIFQSNYNQPNFVQWLILMKPRLITSMNVVGGTSYDEAYFPEAAQVLRGIRVTAGGQHYPARLEKWTDPNAFNFEIGFGEGEDKATYNIVIIGDQLFVYASELRFNTEYTLAPGEAQRVKERLTNPSTYFAQQESAA